MEAGGLGPTEIIVISIVVLFMVAVPVAVIVVLYLVMRRKSSSARTKKCSFCDYSIPVEATVCQFCGRELAQ